MNISVYKLYTNNLQVNAVLLTEQDAFYFVLSNLILTLKTAHSLDVFTKKCVLSTC